MLKMIKDICKTNEKLFMIYDLWVSWRIEMLSRQPTMTEIKQWHFYLSDFCKRK